MGPTVFLPHLSYLPQLLLETGGPPVPVPVPELPFRGSGDEIWSEGPAGDPFKAAFVLQVHIFYLDSMLIQGSLGC